MEINSKRVNEIFSGVKGKKIAVIGDFMLDAYLWGTVDRISPEAPVPVVSVNKRSYCPGGAANVIVNLQKLGVQSLPIGVVGRDGNGKELIRLLQKTKVDTSGILTDPERPTTIKTRIVANHQQVVRADEESVQPISKKTEAALIKKINKIAGKVDGVIYEDYNKGVLTGKLTKESLRLFRKNKVFSAVDPKQKNLSYFRGASLIKPNQKEASLMVNASLDSDSAVNSAAKKILGNYKLDAVLLTLGERGMALYEKELTRYPSVARKVFDVTGAGDTVISIFTALMAAGATLKEAAFLANQAAGIVVGEVGTVAVSLAQIKKTL